MKDSSGQEIVPVAKYLSIHTNRHRNVDGSSWGWIEGCDKNICWSDSSPFGYKEASEFVRQHNQVHPMTISKSEVPENRNLELVRIQHGEFANRQTRYSDALEKILVTVLEFIESDFEILIHHPTDFDAKLALASIRNVIVGNPAGHLSIAGRDSSPGVRSPSPQSKEMEEAEKYIEELYQHAPSAHLDSHGNPTWKIKTLKQKLAYVIDCLSRQPQKEER